jgi:hypothetical protein
MRRVRRCARAAIEARSFVGAGCGREWADPGARPLPSHARPRHMAEVLQSGPSLFKVEIMTDYIFAAHRRPPYRQREDVGRARLCTRPRHLVRADLHGTVRRCQLIHSGDSYSVKELDGAATWVHSFSLRVRCRAHAYSRRPH